MTVKSKPMSGRCPNCGSTNLQTEPIYPYEDEEYLDSFEHEDTGDLAVFCVSCGHYMGEIASHLTARMQAVRSKALDQLADEIKR